MKFIILSDSYPPDMKSGAFLIQTLAQYLSSKGHQITVVSFSDEVLEDHSREKDGGITLIRLRIPAFKYNLTKRALVEITYSFKIISYLKKQHLDFDGVICYSPSIFFGYAVRYIKKRWSIKCYLIVRDLFPDWAVSIGILRKGPIYYFFKYFERVMLKAADFVGVEAKANIEHCKNIVNDREVIVENLLNWYPPIQIKESKPPEFIHKDKFNLIYGGNLGYAQNFMNFLQDLKSVEDQKFRLLIVGSGTERSKIEDFINSHNMDILLLPSMPRDNYLEIVKFSDAGLIVINRDIVANNYPGKSFDYMSYGKPIFAYLNQDNEFGIMIDELNFGYYPNNHGIESFIESFTKMISNHDDRIEKGENAKEVVEREFSVENAGEIILRKF